MCYTTQVFSRAKMIVEKAFCDRQQILWPLGGSREEKDNISILLP